MDNSINLIEFYTKFSNEQACRDYLEQVRWNGKPVCPRCASFKVYKFANGKLWKCGDCRQQFTVRIGTIFEDSRLPLQKWFLAIFLATSLKKGISSLQLSRYLGITQKSAWFMLQRVRYAIEHENYNKPAETDTMEVDETYIGGKGRLRGRTSEKTAVVGIAARHGEVRAEVIDKVDALTLTNFIKKHATHNSVIMTDDWRGYADLKYNRYMHLSVNHSAKEYARGSIYTNTIEGFWSHMKRGIKGIYHQISRKHTNKYLAEYTYRYNTRTMTDFDRFTDWFNMSAGRLTYKALIA